VSSGKPRGFHSPCLGTGSAVGRRAVRKTVLCVAWFAYFLLFIIIPFFVVLLDLLYSNPRVLHSVCSSPVPLRGRSEWAAARSLLPTEISASGVRSAVTPQTDGPGSVVMAGYWPRAETFPLSCPSQKGGRFDCTRERSEWHRSRSHPLISISELLPETWPVVPISAKNPPIYCGRSGNKTKPKTPETTSPAGTQPGAGSCSWVPVLTCHGSVFPSKPEVTVKKRKNSGSHECFRRRNRA